MQNKYKKLFINIIWLFIFGAIFGYIFETLWYIIKNGTFVNKQGLWYGPFKPIYGCGVLLVSGLLYKIKDKNPIWIFIGGVIIGTCFEYFAAVFQEVLFGTYTWTYADFNLNFQGKIYLPYCFAWGAIAFIYYKFIYPYLMKLLNKLYSNKFFILTIIITIFLIYDIILTSLITYRYAKRYNDVEPQNKIMEIIDKYYPDDVVHKKMPKLRIIKAK